MLLFMLCRLLFYFFNYRYFSDISAEVWLGGLRFDWMTISILYLPFGLSSLVFYRGSVISKAFFYLSTVLAVVANVVDFEYYKFTFKRTTFDLFTTKGIGTDLSSLAPTFIQDYWYLLVIGILLTYLSFKAYNQVDKIEVPKQKFPAILLFVIVNLLIWGIGFRGGLQYKPLNVIQAGEYAKAINIPLVVNTPFTIIKSYNKKGLQAAEYFPEKELDEIYQPLKSFSADSNWIKGQRPNVVLLIMEGFSSEYIGALSGNKSYTPFLDSLMQESLVMKVAYANGKKSIEALPAILSSIPSLMNTSYISGKYSSNQIQSIASVLKDQGYQSRFYHGGANGTMGFDAFSNIAGIDEYIGLNEYPKEGDHDGNWGIFDEPFLQFAAEDIDQLPKPFFAGIFTLSSHHPYKIPEQYEGRFPKGPLPILESVAYADYSLKQFFEKINKSEWFDNTLFVITADHTAQSMEAKYASRVGIYDIPLIFFHSNSISAEKKQIITQQADIFPSIIDYLGMDSKIVAFGNSVFSDREDRFAINYINETYQLIMGDHALHFDGEKSIALYNYVKDPLMSSNVLEDQSEVASRMERTLKGIIQQYQNALINNQLVAR